MCFPVSLANNKVDQCDMTGVLDSCSDVAAMHCLFFLPSHRISNMIPGVCTAVFDLGKNDTKSEEPRTPHTPKPQLSTSESQLISALCVGI